ncbi:hypothetical protein H5410_014276 [Solanum commersonii]|uniref:F-box domain-containing protein n=1 Tax=Solanum commersonii TaxID=4109 RepID=A0A9J5ZQW9_SOLCO|nr:hypothetical protein H5410_014276 [Solanum commersonii]
MNGRISVNSNRVKIMKIEDDNEESLKQQLPDEIIYQILTFLPLSSLFKFRCVCKLWNTLYSFHQTS